MGSMKIRNIEIELDFYEELEVYLPNWGEHRIRDNKLQACSPFRHERRPSFAVNLDNGSWIDSGGTDDLHKKGHFTQLLAYLREETWHDTEDYLLQKYSTHLAEDVSTLKLDFQLAVECAPEKVFKKSELVEYCWRVSYLSQRGISEKIQKAFSIGYDTVNKAVMIPWHDVAGNIVNLKFRSIHTKRFWYHPEGQRVKNHIFGLYFVHKHKFETVVAVESETDALYCWSLGIPAIAFGKARMSDKQKELVLRSPIKTLILGTDNDGAGQLFREQLTRELLPYLELQDLPIPEKYKDLNDMEAVELTGLLSKKLEIRSIPMQLKGKQCR